MDPLIEMIESAKGHEKAVAELRDEKSTWGPNNSLQRPTRIKVPLDESTQQEIRDLQGKLPDKKDLPQDIQDFLKKLDSKKLDDVDKIQKIHEFIGNRITSRKESDDPVGNFNDALNTEGDCDNYATLASGLLRYSGFDKGNIYFVVATAEYNFENKSRFKPGHDILREGHAVVIARSGESHYVIDNNLIKPYPLDNNMQAEVHVKIGFVPQKATYSLDPAWVIKIDGDPDSYYFAKAADRIKTQPPLSAEIQNANPFARPATQPSSSTSESMPSPISQPTTKISP